MIQVYKKSSLLFLIGIFFVTSFSFGQTAIGKTEVEGQDVLLDFKVNDNRGIILPWVTSESQIQNPVGGTLIFDSNDKKIKYYKGGTSPEWEDLSINSGSVDLTIQENLTENNSQTIIGKQTSSAPGLLVLEADNKAMVLPKMDSPHLNLKSPAPGTLVYDNVSKMLCIFNGTEWSFWKVTE